MGLKLVLIALILCAWTSEAQIYSPQREIIVSSILSEPFLMRAKDRNLRGNDRFDGFVKDLADKLFEKLGLLYRLKIVADGRYGAKDRITGDWNGMMGELTSKRSDMVLADLSITSSRAEAVDFSVPFMESRLAILLKSKRWNEYDDGDEDSSLFPWFNPMALSFWILFIVASILLIFLIFFIEKFVSRKTGIEQPPPPETLFARFGKRVFGAPKSIAARILQVTFWIFLIICFSAYASNFAADRILQLVHYSEGHKALPINSAVDLLDQDKVKFGILNAGSTYSYFQTSKNELIQKLNTKMMEAGTSIDTYRRGISRVRNANGTFAFIMESPAAKYARMQEPCDVEIASELFGPKKGFAVAISKDSRKLTMSKVNSAILELNEAGFLDSLERKWFKDQTECDDSGDHDDGELFEIERKYYPLTLESMASLFILLTISIFVIFIVAGVETGLNRNTKQTT